MAQDKPLKDHLEQAWKKSLQLKSIANLLGQQCQCDVDCNDLKQHMLNDHFLLSLKAPQPQQNLK
jgi:hypothetical protein